MLELACQQHASPAPFVSRLSTARWPSCDVPGHGVPRPRRSPFCYKDVFHLPRCSFLPISSLQNSACNRLLSPTTLKPIPQLCHHIRQDAFRSSFPRHCQGAPHLLPLEEGVAHLGRPYPRNRQGSHPSCPVLLQLPNHPRPSAAQGRA